MLPTIPTGWRFYSADFSIPASEDAGIGRVMLIRAKEHAERWHRLDEEERSDLPLYIQGTGTCLENAIQDAVAHAIAAPVI